jgi:hypothetical protein
MKIYQKFSIEKFEPWDDSRETYDRLEELGKLDDFGTLIEDCFEDKPIEETVINDIRCHETDWIEDMLGITLWEEDCEL